MTKLHDMKNIGKTFARRMENAGIHSGEELIELGSKTAFLKVRAIYPFVEINQLYALEGAIQNVMWYHLPEEIRGDLRVYGVCKVSVDKFCRLWLYMSA